MEETNWNANDVRSYWIDVWQAANNARHDAANRKAGVIAACGVVMIFALLFGMAGVIDMIVVGVVIGASSVTCHMILDRKGKSDCKKEWYTIVNMSYLDGRAYALAFLTAYKTRLTSFELEKHVMQDV